MPENAGLNPFNIDSPWKGFVTPQDEITSGSVRLSPIGSSRLSVQPHVVSRPHIDDSGLTDSVQEAWKNLRQIVELIGMDAVAWKQLQEAANMQDISDMQD